MKEKRVQWRAILLGAVTLLGLSVSFAAEDAEAVRLLPFTAVWALGAAGLFFLYRAWLGGERPFARMSLWVLAALFAGVMTLAQSFAEVGTTELLTASAVAPIKAGLYWAGRMPLYYAGMWLLAKGLGAYGGEAVAGAVHARGGVEKHLQGQASWQKSRWLWLGLSAALLLCWLPYYWVTFPGVVSNDSVTQLGEIFGVTPLSNGNPIFQTFLIWLCCQLMLPAFGADAAVALYCIVQGVLMAALMGYLLTQMARAYVPRWLFAVSFLLYAFCPIFPLYAFCVGKDTNFAMAVLFFSLMVWKVLCQPRGEKLPVRVSLGLCISAVLVLLLRNPGVYLAGITLVLLLLWALLGKKNRTGPRRQRWIAPAVALAALVGVYAGLHTLVIPSLHAQPMPETEEYSIPLQQVARVVASQPESLSAEDTATISAVMAYDEIKAAYNGELSDPVKLLWNEDATPDEKQAFFRLWLRLLPSHAPTYFSATFHNTYGYLCPGYVSTIKPTLLIGKQKRTTDIDPYFSFSVGKHSDALKSAMDSLLEMPLPRLLMAPGLYGWLTLFAAVVLLWRRKGEKASGKALLIAAFPAVFTLAGCLLSAVNGYFRYAMPLYFSAPFLLLLCVQALRPEAEIPEDLQEVQRTAYLATPAAKEEKPL